jgi:hypothetical protein
VKRLSTLTTAEGSYSLEQSTTKGMVDMPTVAGLINPNAGPSDYWLLGSVQQLHTAEPELIVHNWIDEKDKARIEAEREAILAWAADHWRIHYDPADFADASPAQARAQDNGESPDTLRDKGLGFQTSLEATLFNLALALSAGIWIVPEGTPRLIPAAVGSLVTLAIGFTFNLVALRNLRQALRSTRFLAAFLVVTFALLAAWIGSGTFPEGAYS